MDKEENKGSKNNKSRKQASNEELGDKKGAKGKVVYYA